MEHPCYYKACICSNFGTSEHVFRTSLLGVRSAMIDTIICDVCLAAKPWQRFRMRLGKGVQKESTTCSDCRAKKSRFDSATKIRLKKQRDRKVVLNRTQYQKQLELGVPHYFPDIERDMKTYCGKRTAKDRKYLRDNQDKPISINPRIAQQQTTAREHAKGWIAFYDEICEHAINLLRQTGTRPPWAQMEGSGTLHLVYGIHNTKRAQQLRDRG